MTIRPLSHRSILPGALLALGALTGCTGGSGGDPADGPTYHRDARPILEAKCTGCHTEGGIAPFLLTSYADAKRYAGALASAVSSRTMPPWPPSDECGTYLFDRSLSDDEIALLTAWVDAGALEGDPDDAKPAGGAASGLSRVDLELTMPEAYTPETSPDDYRCFLVDWPDTETVYVTGVGVEPGDRALVHPVIAFIATPDVLPSYQALDDDAPGPGYPCFGGPGSASAGRARWLGSWVPGSVGVDFPEGTGVAVPPGSKIVFQVHYNTASAKPAPDRTTMLVKKDSSVAKEGMFLPWTNPAWPQDESLTLPPHANDVTYSFDKDPTPYLGILSNGGFTSDQPFTVHSSALHMHTLGTRAKSEILRADGARECVLDLQRWDFHWQGQYWLEQPRTFNPGDQLHIECHWDNPTDAVVSWGEGTKDEMCLGVHYITQ
jgi:hypothetical protein